VTSSSNETKLFKFSPAQLDMIRNTRDYDKTKLV